MNLNFKPLVLELLNFGRNVPQCTQKSDLVLLFIDFNNLVKQGGLHLDFQLQDRYYLPPVHSQWFARHS